MTTEPHPKNAHLPREFWCGIQLGEWPLVTFPDERMARDWAGLAPEAIGAGRARRIWRMEIPDDVEIFRVVPVPATTRMEAI